MADDSIIRSEVAHRARNRCEYCQLPEQFTQVPFQLDHVIAAKHEGPTVAENLAYACLHCNSYKGPNLAGRDYERNQTVRLYDPRSDHWDDHFEWEGPVLRPRTSIGKVTIAVLRINLPRRVALRAELIDQGVFPPDGTDSG
jgi:hypothetical protein